MVAVTIEEFQDRLKEHPQDITVLEFSGSTKPAKFRYNCCGAIKELTSAKGIFRSKTCPKCSPENNAHSQQYVQDTFLKPLGLSFVGEYKNERAPVELLYPCGCTHIKTISAIKANSGTSCLNCTPRIKNPSIPLKDTNNKLSSQTYGSYKVVGGYRGISVKTDIKCLDCGNVHKSVSPKQVLNWTSPCGICSGNQKGSVQERYIRQILTDLGIEYVCEYYIAGLRLDFYLPTLNKAIEFDGKWHDISKEQQLRDTKKDNLLKDRNIVLLRIHHTEKAIVKKLLKFLN